MIQHFDLWGRSVYEHEQILSIIDCHFIKNKSQQLEKPKYCENHNSIILLYIDITEPLKQIFVLSLTR